MLIPSKIWPIVRKKCLNYPTKRITKGAIIITLPKNDDIINSLLIFFIVLFRFSIATKKNIEMSDSSIFSFSFLLNFSDSFLPIYFFAFLYIAFILFSLTLSLSAIGNKQETPIEKRSNRKKEAIQKRSIREKKQSRKEGIEKRNNREKEPIEKKNQYGTNEEIIEDIYRAIEDNYRAIEQNYLIGLYL